MVCCGVVEFVGSLVWCGGVLWCGMVCCGLILVSEGVVEYVVVVRWCVVWCGGSLNYGGE